jgi:hypothetical protein
VTANSERDALIRFVNDGGTLGRQDWAAELEWVHVAGAAPGIGVRYNHTAGAVWGYGITMITDGRFWITGWDDNGSSTWLGALAITGGSIGLSAGTRYIMRAYIQGTSLFGGVYAAATPHTAIATLTATNSSIASNGVTAITQGSDDAGVGQVKKIRIFTAASGNGGAWCWPENVSDTSIKLKRTPLSWGHASPTSRHLHRSTSANFTAGAGNIVATIADNAADVTDTGLSPDTTYYYKWSNLISGTYTAGNEVRVRTRTNPSVAIGILSDSTWEDDRNVNDTETTATQAHYLRFFADSILNRDVTNVYNESVSGWTAAQSLAGGKVTDLMADLNADTATQKLVVIEFGLNELLASTSAATYIASIEAIVDAVWAEDDAALVLVSHPRGFIANTGSGLGATGQALLDQYLSAINSYVAGDTNGQLYLGATQHREEALRQPRLWFDGLHANNVGLMNDAIMTLNAVKAALAGSGTEGTSGRSYNGQADFIQD